MLHLLGRIQDLVRGGSDKRPPTLSNGYCNLTSPFFTRKSMVEIIFPFHFRGFEPPEPPLNPPQICERTCKTKAGLKSYSRAHDRPENN